MGYTATVHVISRKTLRDFWERYPDSETALIRWFKIRSKTGFGSFAELRATFPSADKVGKWVIFNVCGNKYRLVSSVHFNRGKVYVRYVLTHNEYEKEHGSNECSS